MYITTRQRTGGWLAEAFAADSAVEVVLEEVVGSAAALGRLRDEAFDAVLISHEPDELDALDLIEGYRTGGADEPMIVLGTQSEQEMAALCYEVGADAYVCVHTATTRNLIWIIARAIQRHQLLRENQHFQHAEQTRLQREHDEATRLIQEQWAALEGSRAGGVPRPARRLRRRPAASPAAAGIDRPLSRIAADLRHHGVGQSQRRVAAAGGNAGHRRPDRPANHATPSRKCWRNWSTAWAAAARGT